MLSGRGAAARLAEVGVARRHARRLLDLGFAGRPTKTGREHWFDAERLEDLVRWPRVVARDLRAAFPAGLLVARRDVPFDGPWSEQAAHLRDGWRIGLPAVIGDLRGPLEATGRLPLVATVAGFVAAGAEVTGCRADSDQYPGPGRHRGGAHRGGPNTPPLRWSFELEPPGEWFQQIAGHQLPNPRGPHLWVLPPMGESRL